MALQKNQLNVAFAGGLDTKTDPKQVIPGKMLLLQNATFNVPGRFTKRNGYEKLVSISNATGLTTFQNELLSLSATNVQSFDQNNMSLINKGFAAFVTPSYTQIVANANQQTMQDMSQNTRGFKIVCWEDSSGGSRYSVIDTTTGNRIVNNALLNANAAMPKTVAFGTVSIIFFINTNTNFLQYCIVAASTPGSISSPVNIAAVSSSHYVYDIAATSSRCFITYLDGSNDVTINYLNTAFNLLALPTQTGDASVGPLTCFLDLTANDIYIAYQTSSAIRIASYNFSLSVQHFISTVESITGSHNITGTVDNKTGRLFYEISASPSYNTFLKTASIANYAVGSASVFVRSLGLGTKAFMQAGFIYVCGLYDSGIGQQLSTTTGAPQNKYILLNASGVAVGKYLAEPNTAGALSSRQGLPSVTSLDGLNYDVALLINTSTTGFAFQLNQSVGEMDLAFGTISTKVELGNNLHIAAGSMLFMYDGNSVTEHSYNFYPENSSASLSGSGGSLTSGSYEYEVTYEWNDNQGQLHRSAPSQPLIVDTSHTTPTPVTFTAVFASGANSFTASSTTGLFVGQVLTDSTTGGNLQAGTTITKISGSTITIDLPTAGASAGSPGDTLSTSYTISSALTIPTLRVTSKVGVNCVVYRTQANGTIFYRVGSVVNSTTANTVSFTDTVSDYALAFNEQLYTNGGEVENIAMPATALIAQYQNRLVAIPAENPYQVMYSKQTGRSVGSALLSPVNFSSEIFYINVDQRGGALTSLSPLDDKLALFKESSIFYMYGQGPAPNGTNNDFSNPVLVTTDSGCVDSASVVIMPQGLMYKSAKGIYLLNRAIQSSYIGADVQSFNASTITSGRLITTANEVRFSLDDGETILVFNYFTGQWATFVDLNAVDSVLFQGLYTYLDTALNSIYQETPGSYTDDGKPIAIKAVTSWLSMVGIQGFQRVMKLLFLGDYLSPHSLTVSVAYDFNPSVTQTTIINTQAYTQYTYGSDYTYGATSPEGGESPQDFQFGIFTQRQKCESIQITLEENPLTPYGQGLSMSGIAMEVGQKKGLYKLPASKLVG